MDLKILDGRKQVLIVLGKIVNFYWWLINNSSGYWKLADSYKGKSGRREAFRLSLFILINDIQITQKYTLVIVDTLGVFLVNIIFINIILITQIYTLSDQDVIDKDDINKEDSQYIRTNQSILFCDLNVIDEDKETEYECLPMPTITFLNICEFPIPGRVVYK